MAKLSHLSLQAWTEVTLTVRRWHQHEIAAGGGPHPGDVQTLLRVTVSAGTITPNQPSIEAGGYRGALADQGFCNSFRILVMAGSTRRNCDPPASRFE
jgi:hypothetical protein